MPLKLFSDRNRPVHLGPYPLEKLARAEISASELGLPWEPLRFEAEDGTLIAAMSEHQAMMDAIRDGLVAKTRSTIPDDPLERANHLKAFAYFSDASMVGVARLSPEMRLEQSVRNPGIDALAEALKTRQTKTLASGIDMIMADLKESMEAPPTSIQDHTHVLVLLSETPREPLPDEPGGSWIAGSGAHRSALRTTEIATILANYIRVLGWDARAHSVSTSDIDLNKAARAAGLVFADGTAPWVGKRFALAAVTTTLELSADLPLAALDSQPKRELTGLRWRLGTSSQKSARTRDPFENRQYSDGPHPFETLKRVPSPTTYIDEPNVPRVPKRTDMFARAQFGDMGKAVQAGATAGHYARKAAPSMAQRRLLGAFVLLQDGVKNARATSANSAKSNAEMVKAVSYWLGADAVGLSRCPDWAWYSHDATGTPIHPSQPNAVSMIIDQGFETMDGASGDDWISVAQSMRAYLRFSLLGGVLAALIRSLGYSAKAHTVLDGDVLQPPLLLLSGLGEVSRIGEVILNPFLGPRLKSGVVTTDMPMNHDQPIDFGLQNFCETCQKCARECPSGAITAGPKLMFNGYEIWKSDSQRCASYRITTEGGAMCGRCMKTCPWNLEGLFAEEPFRWVAMHIPQAAPLLAKLDDLANRGSLNPVKKWWWDIELAGDGAYHPTQKPINARDLQKGLKLRAEDQTLAIYPAPLAPHPWPYPFPMDREAGIEAFQALLTAEEYQKRLALGETAHLHRYETPEDSPVLRLEITEAEEMAPGLTRYTFKTPERKDLPAWEAGAHLDIVVAPEFLRQYSLCSDPSDRTKYEIAVLREDAGRGGSKLLSRIFNVGRKVFVSRPINHFPLVENAEFTFLMGGGIGITPMIAMAHKLYQLGRPFALHYSIRSRDSAGFLKRLRSVPWSDRVTLHVSKAGSRCNLLETLKYRAGSHVYTCGPEAYMSSVLEAATANGFPEDAQHFEYFHVPELPEYENHPFMLQLRDGRQVAVSADESATDALARHSVHVDVKCSDGICGVCQCGLRKGEVEHRDFVLSKAQRQDRIILCQSRAAEPGGVIEIDL